MSTGIYSAISKIMSEVGAIKKGRTNSQQNYAYRGIDDVTSALQPLLAKHGVFFTSEVTNNTREERTTRNGSHLLYSILTVKFKFFASDGSHVESTMLGEGMDSGDKASNKAMSSALKYALFQIFCIPTEEADLDTENQSHYVGPQDPGEHDGMQHSNYYFPSGPLAKKRPQDCSTESLRKLDEAIHAKYPDGQFSAKAQEQLDAIKWELEVRDEWTG